MLHEIRNGVDVVSDVLRFNPDQKCFPSNLPGCLVIYSDNSDFDSGVEPQPNLADIGLPDDFYANRLDLDESGGDLEGFNGLNYKPSLAQPGAFLTTEPPIVKYIFGGDTRLPIPISIEVPEPASLWILVAGLACLSLLRHAKRAA